MKTEFIKWFTNGNNGRAPEIKEDGEFVQMKTRHMFEAYQAGANSGEITALVATHEKCREITNCPGEVDLQDWVKQLAAENVALKQAESNLVRNIINDLGDTEFQYARVHTPATDRIVAGIKVDAQSEVIEWLDAEITAIDTIYRGDPSYERDAYWMKSEVLDVVELARKAFSAKLREGTDK